MEIPAHIENWLQILESDQYKQVKHTLCGELKDSNDVGYCCLGVYLDSRGTEVPVEKLDKNDSYQNGGPSNLYAVCRNELGSYIAEIGMDLNDKGESFRTIAEEIRNRFESSSAEKLITYKVGDYDILERWKTIV